MKIGDIVVRKSYRRDITFKIIDIKETKKGVIYSLKGINLRIIADSPEDDLELVSEEALNEREKIFSRKVNSSIKNIMLSRGGFRKELRIIKPYETSELSFGRPGKILHVDGDPEYLDVCLKVYKQLMLDVVGKYVAESEQPKVIVDLVKQVKPDIVIITGHDSIAKDIKDYTDLSNYKNSKYYVQSVIELRNYQSSYDELVVFAGACQSCYEAILDAGANFASSPSRILIHCLDPVFLCEKIAYTNIEKVVSIRDALENTITGTKGIGGLQTRGRYREGFPKSSYI
ncbi:sporulation peptidase YabG [Clostridiaceae bacterium UIB06]|uniref:Sporulation peptidase YabG n=1 Tax=Clostridium thailandense TaxID=2794346 RepID=A0A949WQ74_9CLOT|nr:sporulation peptidase YabG [Clostridium thailandense]MBV7272376.1 sporulation peptidase YabG [Clostridium thailandense]MCH5135911.1 sporulation peptidase YabG [Clostridiaceae bacterium UIB06]